MNYYDVIVTSMFSFGAEQHPQDSPGVNCFRKSKTEKSYFFMRIKLLKIGKFINFNFFNLSEKYDFGFQGGMQENIPV